MCIGGTPSIPQVPERQTIKQPTVAPRDVSSDDERRRRGMLATLLTSSAGALSPLSTTASPASKLG